MGNKIQDRRFGSIRFEMVLNQFADTLPVTNARGVFKLSCPYDHGPVKILVINALGQQCLILLILKVLRKSADPGYKIQSGPTRRRIRKLSHQTGRAEKNFPEFFSNIVSTINKCGAVVDMPEL